VSLHPALDRRARSPWLPIVATTHDGVRLDLDPVLTPISPLVALVAWGGSIGALGAARLATAIDAVLLLVLAVALGAVAVRAAVHDLRVQVSVEGRRLVVWRTTAVGERGRALPLAEVREVRITGRGLSLIPRPTPSGPTRPLRIPLTQRSSATAEAVRRFVLDQVAQARLEGEVPAELGRLVDQAEAE
jgi:hypothetical protein